MTLDSSGDLFGTTAYGGTSNGEGTVFELAHGTQFITTLATFYGTNGAYPEAGLTLDARGNLYGTTNAGGIDIAGTVFELSPDTSGVSPVSLSPYENSIFSFTGSSFTAAFNNTLNNPCKAFRSQACPPIGGLP